MSFERLCNNKSDEHSNCFTAYYSSSENQCEQIYKQEIQQKPSSTTKNLLKFGLMASLSITSVGMAYTAYDALKPR